MIGTKQDVVQATYKSFEQSLMLATLGDFPNIVTIARLTDRFEKAVSVKDISEDDTFNLQAHRLAEQVAIKSAEQGHNAPIMRVVAQIERLKAANVFAGIVLREEFSATLQPGVLPEELSHPDYLEEIKPLALNNIVALTR